MDRGKDILTIPELTEIVGCGDNTILRWIKKGGLKAKVEWRGLKRTYKIERSDWEAFWAEKKKTLTRFKENS